MPDDAEQKHSDKLRFERNLMRATGVSRSQIRRSLHEFAQRTSPSPAERLSQANIKAQIPEIRVETATLEPKTMASQSVPIVPAPSLAGNPTDFTFVNNDGVLATYTIPATFVAFP